MRITSLSVVWLACTFASSTRAFSALSKKNQLSSASAFSRPARRQIIGRQQEVESSRSSTFFPLRVASTEPISVADMERGMGGRLESAFETAKEKGEAAFVAFITAGYPKAEGTFVCF